MLSNRPYIIRAMYEWMVDNQWTPHMQVDANYPGIQIPRAFVQEGGIVFNVSPHAVQALDMQNNWFQFRARFQGVEQVVAFPPEAVLAIFARENGQGMPFPPEPYPDIADEPSSKPTLSAVEGEGKNPESDSGKGKEPSKKPVKKKPTLSVVK
ncbi:MAG: ClpXP protease specificity-enhancing factor [Thiotrichales bacterium]|nr:ClpXP protease specificity-enhancing factor [Thiotrichales bacterium]